MDAVKDKVIQFVENSQNHLQSSQKSDLSETANSTTEIRKRLDTENTLPLKGGMDFYNETSLDVVDNEHEGKRETKTTRISYNYRVHDGYPWLQKIKIFVL